MNFKKGEFSFVWLFAILAGAAILMLAIYGATKSTSTMRYAQEAELTKSFSVILGPLGAGFSDSKKSTVAFKQDTRIENYCSDIKFGENTLSLSTKSSTGETWTENGAETSIKHQYVFSSFQENKKFDVFSKPFDYPFEVADLIFISSEDFCLKNVPTDIEKQISSLQLSRWKTENCTGEETTICFQSSMCDINIYGTCTSDCKSKYDEGYVEKEGERLYFVGSLLYGAILSEKELYDCNINRLMYRTAQIAAVLADKTSLMDLRGCSTNLAGELGFWSSIVSSMSPSEVVSKNQVAKQIQEKADKERCKSW